ncbi:competence/damage-inducible protein A [Paracidobacterium acidisoli]|uniref:CinA-like protein n=1 Tax=Paracidobacterium acidisoli TaxID=2303751 RepID=A0A372ITF6_9BACT|nr:competence/damage-inducible protein A [Paracidobacterium acidisoli]MBT9329635.1 competence/damage-inducible protein A [Paracidobacterium acidisoli]
MNSEIIAIGSELLTPWRQDTNSLYITEKLTELGVSVAFKTIAGDRRKHLVSAVRTALQRVDIVVITGGLGPTEDDLTREAVAEALNIGIKRDPDIIAHLYARAAARRMTMTRNNEKQADVLDGATILANPRGSAPGQWLDTVYGDHRKLIMLLPGPPGEMKPLFDEQCRPRLEGILPKRAFARRTLKAAMIGESAADARIAPIYTQYQDVETTILAHMCDIQIDLFCAKPFASLAQTRVDELAERLEEELDDVLYSSQGESLEQIVLYYLGMRGATISVAESCTGGLVAERLTSISGSSRSFMGGAVVYSDQLKTEFAGVSPALIERHGAVSREVATALAEGIRLRCETTFGVGITGIAGPGGGTEEKPVGLVYISVSDGEYTETVEKRFSGDRERIRFFASHQALDLVRRRLM